MQKFQFKLIRTLKHTAERVIYGILCGITGVNSTNKLNEFMENLKEGSKGLLKSSNDVLGGSRKD